MKDQRIVPVLVIVRIFNSNIVVAALKWSIKQVEEWARDVVGLDEDDVALLTKQKINGRSLASMTREEFKSYGIPGGPAAELFEGVKKLFPEQFGDIVSAPSGNSLFCISYCSCFVDLISSSLEKTFFLLLILIYCTTASFPSSRCDDFEQNEPLDLLPFDSCTRSWNGGDVARRLLVAK